ncbi:MAG: 5-oxoprolinase subunit PxpB [Halarcobacter sp.]
MVFKIASVDSLIIYFGNEINEKIAQDVKKAYLCLKGLNIEGLVQIIPSYTSIFISYDVLKYDYTTLKELLKSSIHLDYDDNSKENIINIDVYYGEEVGLDLKNMSQKTKLSIDEIIQIHSNRLYDVYAIGFLPGFAYLASVDERIAFPRLDTPRKQIPKGSVAIADTQTAVYPQNSPGGWNIVGKTTMELFDKKLEKLSPLSVGDKVKFNSISKEKFLSSGGVI